MTWSRNAKHSSEHKKTGINWTIQHIIWCYPYKTHFKHGLCHFSFAIQNKHPAEAAFLVHCIPEDDDNPDFVPVFMDDGCGTVLDGPLDAESGNQEGGRRQTLHIAFIKHIPDDVLMFFAGHFVENGKHFMGGMPHGLILCPAGQQFRRTVQRGDIALDVYGEDAVPLTMGMFLVDSSSWNRLPT